MATALVSEPPRPRVATRPSRVTPWKPAITATSPPSIAAPSFSGGISSMRARPWASSAMIGICQPVHERARMPHVAQGHGQQSCRHLLAGGDHHVVFVVGGLDPLGGRAGAVGPRHQLVGLAGHRRDHHGYLMARVPLGADQPRHPADALQVSHGRTAEFHHQPGHGPRAEPLLRCRRAAPSSDAPRRPQRPESFVFAAPGARRGHEFPRGRPFQHRSCRRRTVLADRGGVVGSAGQVRAAAQVQSRSPRLHPRPGALRFKRDARARRPFEGLRLLDIGCGGGLLSEPMTRLGFAVTGVDASERNIGTARAHAQGQGLDIDYRAATAEALVEAGEPPFDAILNMEVIEHVADPGAYLRDCARC
jgi:hypothetical protein